MAQRHWIDEFAAILVSTFFVYIRPVLVNFCEFLDM